MKYIGIDIAKSSFVAAFPKAVDALESERAAPFPKRNDELKTGRPIH